MSHNADAQASTIAPVTGEDQLVASRLHTLVVLLIMAVGAFYGPVLGAWLGISLHMSRARLFLIGIGQEWFLFALIAVGVLRAKLPLSCVVGERWHSRREFFRDLGVAAGFWLAAIPALYLAKWLFGADALNAGVREMLPRGLLEDVLWFGISMSAGICEEVVFRGYLQRQLIAISGSRPAGILASAVVFGSAHMYQGWRMASVVGCYGLMFGLLAFRRRTVRPGMIAHAWQDLITGLLGAYLLRR